MTLRSPGTQESAGKAGPYRSVARTGFYTGLLLTLVMFVALVVANRVPAFEGYAIMRNAVSGGLFFILAVIPIMRFLSKPLQMFCSAMIAWVIFAAGYNLAGLIFQNLFQAARMQPFHVFALGASVYGLCAVGSWVVGTILHVRRRPAAPQRPDAREAVNHTQ
jgi:hypothetical protein